MFVSAATPIDGGMGRLGCWMRLHSWDRNWAGDGREFWSCRRCSFDREVYHPGRQR